MGMKTGGEIVQVQGGHVLRSTGRKDRHSKVFTAKGPRDRRVRLSAHTAIRFYDVQDRLGYDRPSKAVDWLIKKAKFAIDKLAELPPYYPIADGFACNTDPNDKPNEQAIGTDEIESGEYDSQLQRQSDSTFAPSLETFFPTSSATTSINFQGNPIDMILRPTNPAQDLGLSLHNFHDSRLFPSHTEEDTSPSPTNDQRLITDSIPAGYEAYQKMTGVNWNDARETDHAGLWLQPLLGQSSAAFSQRGTLQSSLTHSVPIRAWSSSNHRTHPNQLLLGTRFDGSSEFRTPSRIHGEGEENIFSGRHSSSPNYRH